MYTYQIKLLDELYCNISENNNVLKNNSEKIRELLYYTLNYSMEYKKKEKEAGERILKRQNQISVNVNTYDIAQKGIIRSVDFSTNDKVIYGIHNIFSFGISLLETAINSKHSDNNIIYLTFYNSMDMSLFSDNRIFCVRNLLLKAIDNGWKITFLLRIDSNIERVMRFMHFVLPLICTGKIYIYYINKYDSLMTANEMYIVSGIGTLSCYPSEQSSVINCGFYIRNKAANDVLTNYLNLLIKNNTQSLIKYYLHDMKDEYHRTLSETTEKAGNQFNYNCSFHTSFIPEGLYKKLLLQTNLSQQEKLLSLHYYKRQLNGIIANLQNYKCNNIFFSETLENLIKNSTFFLYTFSGIEMVKMGTQDMIEYLQNVIYYIMTFDNFNMAVIFHENNFEKTKVYNYVIKERRSVYLNVFGSPESTSVQLSIEEPMTVKAFAEYYNILWEKIAPINKDKKEIIKWLQSYINILHEIIYLD